MIGRTFAGVQDADGDGQFETVLIFNSKTTRQADAAGVLRAFGAQQVIMLGRPTLHRTVSALLADSSVPVLALTTGPRWPDVSGNSQATGTRAVTVGEPDPDWLRRCGQC